MRYTAKDMRVKLESANQTLEKIGHPWRLSINSSNGSNFLEYATPEQAARHGTQDSIYGACGTPQQIANFIKCYMQGAHQQAEAKETLERRASDLLDAKHRAWNMGYDEDDTFGLDLGEVYNLIRTRAIEELRERQRAQEQQTKEIK